MALAPTSFCLNNCPCAHIPDNYLIKLLIAAENWRKWLCKYFLSSGFIQVTCWRVWQTRDTDPVPGKSSKELFFWKWILGCLRPFLCLFAYFFHFFLRLCNTYCAEFFQLQYASKQMWWLLQKGVLVYLHENTGTNLSQIRSKVFFYLNVIPGKNEEISWQCFFPYLFKWYHL